METTEHTTVYDTQDKAVNRLEATIANEPVLAFRGAFLRDYPKAEMYLVGGAVRDAILGRKNKDFDFVVRNMTPDQLSSWGMRHGRIDLTGRNFGVFKFLPQGFSTKDTEFVDIAFPRTEHSSADSQGGYRDFETQTDINLPIETDLSRRDFTFNAVAYDLRGGRLVDPFGGQADLEERQIRAVRDPSERFREDMSRMLRAIRFACQLGFEIEPETWKALQQKMPDINKKRVRKEGKTGKKEFVVPRETIGKEIGKSLLADPAKAARLLADSGALRELWPEIAEYIADHPDYLAPFESKAALEPTAAAILLLRAMPSGTAKSLAETVGLHSLPSGNAARVNTETVKWVLERLEDKMPDPAAMPGAQFETRFMNERGGALLQVLRALGKTEASEQAEARMRQIRLRWPTEEGQKIAPLVSGRDVLDLGVKPGPEVRILLERVRSAQLDGGVMDRDQALALLRALHAETAATQTQSGNP